MNKQYQPKTGKACSCRKGVQRDNCPNCEGTGMVIDFAAIRARKIEIKPQNHCSCGDREHPCVEHPDKGMI